MPTDNGRLRYASMSPASSGMCAITSSRNQSNSPSADASGHTTIGKPQRNLAVGPLQKVREDLLARLRSLVKRT